MIGFRASGSRGLRGFRVSGRRRRVSGSWGISDGGASEEMGRVKTGPTTRKNLSAPALQPVPETRNLGPNF